MKKQITFHSLISSVTGLFISLSVNAQTLYVPSGTSGIGSSSGTPNSNIGFGTSTPSNYLAGTNGLVLFGTYPGLAFSRTSKTWLFWANSDNSFRLWENGANLDRVTVLSGGNVGIGTTNPVNGKLVLSRGGGIPDLELSSNTGADTWGVGIRASGGSNYSALRLMSSSGLVQLYDNTPTNYTLGIYNGNTLGVSLTASGTSYFNGGSVGIGTTNTGSFKLAVEGKIAAREVLVTNANPFPDYVFEEGYTLLSLPETEAFINANKHLPEIPSACEVEENNGINMGEMGMLQMKKIEEIYLHLIAINKKVEQLQEENKQLKIQLQQAGK